MKSSSRIFCVLLTFLISCSVRAEDGESKSSKLSKEAPACIDALLKGAEKELADFYNDPIFNPKKRRALEYLRLQDVEPGLVDFLDPSVFISDMRDKGIAEDPSGDYARDCESLCENSVFWALIRLRNEPALLKNLRIVFGSFYVPGLPIRFEHVWLQLNSGDKSYYIDLTLRQFIASAPDLAVVKAEEDETTYHVWAVATVEEYLESQRRRLEFEGL